MTIHMLVEGPSERALLEPWSRRLLLDQSVVVHPHQGKGSLPRDLDARPEQGRRGLLDQLPATLRGYAAALDPAIDSVVVLLDADNDDPVALETEIAAAATVVAPTLRVVVRVAVEETEAFYLGDLRGLARAFPAANLAMARAYTPDSICGTWERFGEVVGDGGGNKVAWAAAMAPVLTVVAARSRSPSFKRLLVELKTLRPPKAARTKRRYRHPIRPKRNSGKRR
jgi:hypothetical protein